MNNDDPQIVRIEWDQFGNGVQHRDADEDEEHNVQNNIMLRNRDIPEMQRHRHRHPAGVRVPTPEYGFELHQFLCQYSEVMFRVLEDTVSMEYDCFRGDDKEHAQQVIFTAAQRMVTVQTQVDLTFDWEVFHWVSHGIEFETPDRKVVLALCPMKSEGTHRVEYYTPDVNEQDRFPEIHDVQYISVENWRRQNGYEWALEFIGAGRDGVFSEILAMTGLRHSLCLICLDDNEDVVGEEPVLTFSFIEYRV